MNTDKTGGPAFPTIIDEQDPHQLILVGMTLRDWFAGNAMQRALTVAGVALVDGSDNNRTMNADLHMTIARIAYEMADAMLKERQR
jgi:hypothetical protein